MPRLLANEGHARGRVACLGRFQWDVIEWEESVPDTESGLSPPMVHEEENKLVRANLDGVAVVAATL